MGEKRRVEGEKKSGVEKGGEREEGGVGEKRRVEGGGWKRGVEERRKVERERGRWSGREEKGGGGKGEWGRGERWRERWSGEEEKVGGDKLNKHETEELLISYRIMYKAK